MITISGLTHKQRVFMDVMWCMQDMATVNAFIQTLPTRDAQDCESLVEIAQLETLELEGALDAWETHARMCIDHASRL